MIKWSDKRYWYFVTQVDMGSVMSLSPRTPIGMCDDEPWLKRICVAPTAHHCMSAIGIYSGANIYVYRTRKQVRARKPYNVGDSDFTKEHWLTSRTRFTLVATLEAPLTMSWEHSDRGCYVGEPIPVEQRRDKVAIRSWLRRRDKRLAYIKHANTCWKMKDAYSTKTIMEQYRRKNETNNVNHA
ncbi:MAG: hypothetical protein [Caudoviricetes sp.]|nr:MAG: hypothetical protein [Caudoviricetes sp.]